MTAPPGEADKPFFETRVMQFASAGLTVVGSLVSIVAATLDHPAFLYGFGALALASAVVFLAQRFFLFLKRSVRDAVKEESFEILRAVNAAVAPGYFERVEIEDVIRHENRAQKILVITNNFKFEKLSEEKIEGGGKFKKMLAERWHKYHYILPRTYEDQGKGELRSLLAELGPRYIEEFLKERVALIEDRYFALLRPFPERTYVFQDGSVVCDFYPLRGELLVFYQFEARTSEEREQAKAFLKAFDDCFKQDSTNLPVRSA